MSEHFSESERRRLQKLIEQTPGPAPWFWESFPAVTTESGRKLEWIHHGTEGSLKFLVTLNEIGRPNDPLLALNTYATPFLMGNNLLGIWCPEGRGMIRLMAFDPDKLQPFAFEEIVGWFKNSSDRVYSAVQPQTELEFSTELAEGTHEIAFPPEFSAVPELCITASRRAISDSDAACAIFVLYPQAGLIQVLPQSWFNTAEYEVGRVWITRVARDNVSHRIVGGGMRLPSFCLTEDGKAVASWLT